MKHCLGSLALLVLLGLSSARAGVTINLFAGQFYNADGTSPVPDGSLVLLISDTTGNGFGGLTPGSLSTGSFIDGFDDLILARATVSLTELGNASVQDAMLSDTEFYGNWNAGDALALVWFSSLDASASTLSAGTEYGFFTTTTPQDESGSWVTPADGSTIDLKFLNSVAGGTYDPSLFRTNLVVGAVPEPSAYAIMAGALTLVWTLVRRRGARPRLTA